MNEHFTLRAAGIAATLDPSIGHLIDFVVKTPSGEICPLARVPWADNPPTCEAIEAAPHLAKMGGDFFCAPFASSDIEPAPPHGHPANSRWTLLQHDELADGSRAVWRLDQKVMGATLVKEWRLFNNDPYLYQAHVFEGGQGAISFAHHVLINVQGGAKLTMSPRGEARTPDIITSSSDDFASAVLAYPASSSDFSRFPTKGGGTVDLLRYPLAAKHDDFVMVLDAASDAAKLPLEWSCIQRTAFNDAVVLFKPSNLMPQTMLWYSNGGRQAPPWSGRHVDVLGVEDACAWSLYGHSASVERAATGQVDVPLCTLELGAQLRIPYAIGVHDLQTISRNHISEVAHLIEASPIEFRPPRKAWFNSC